MICDVPEIAVLYILSDHMSFEASRGSMGDWAISSFGDNNQIQIASSGA